MNGKHIAYSPFSANCPVELAYILYTHGYSVGATADIMWVNMINISARTA